MDLTNRLRRLKFRAWHRGTREADYMIGGFFDCHHAQWDAAALDWFEALARAHITQAAGFMTARLRALAEASP